MTPLRIPASGPAGLKQQDLHALSEEMQGVLANLFATAEQLDPYAPPANIMLVKKRLKEQLVRLRDVTSLLGTIIETDSSEILRYVKKRPR